MLCALWVDAASLPSLPWHDPTRRPYLPSSRAARLGKSSVVACAYLDAVARVILQSTCHVPPHPRRSRSSLHRKAHGPRGRVEGRLRVNMAVLIGCQMSADWHARLRLTARIVMASRDGTVAPRTAWRCGSVGVGGGQQEQGEGCLHGWRSPLPGVGRGRRTPPLHLC